MTSGFATDCALGLVLLFDYSKTPEGEIGSEDFMMIKQCFFLILIPMFATMAFASETYWNSGTGPGSATYWNSGTGPGSETYWNSGTGPGSETYWNSGTGPGSESYWNSGTGPGSETYWNSGTGPGSESYWNSGTGPSVIPAHVVATKEPVYLPND